MRAGPKRQRVVVQGIVEAKDSYGQLTQTWLTLATVWAEVRFLSGREAVNAKQIKAEATHLFTTRYVAALFASPGILTTMRLQHDGVTYGILSVNNVNNRQREYQILAQALPQPSAT